MDRFKKRKVVKMKKDRNLIVGFSLVLGGQILYYLKHFMSLMNVTLNEFVDGLFLGLSVGINLIGIVLLAKYILGLKKWGWGND